MYDYGIGIQVGLTVLAAFMIFMWRKSVFFKTYTGGLVIVYLCLTIFMWMIILLVDHAFQGKL